MIRTTSLGERLKCYSLRAPEDVIAIVIHTTGLGVIGRYQRDKKDPSPFHTAIRVYEYLMREGPHYVIGQGQDQIAQVCDESLAAWHVGSKGHLQYRSSRWINPTVAWWGKRWAPLLSPRDLADGKLWEKGSVNRVSIGIEVVPDESDPRGPWSAHAWASIEKLARDLASRYGIPWLRDHVITHSDCHPLARSSKGKPWDPNPAQWTPEILGLG